MVNEWRRMNGLEPKKEYMEIITKEEMEELLKEYRELNDKIITLRRKINNCTTEEDIFAYTE